MRIVLSMHRIDPRHGNTIGHNNTRASCHRHGVGMERNVPAILTDTRQTCDNYAKRFV